MLVYQKKPIRDRQYAGKSDKKERSREGILVGYSDSTGKLTTCLKTQKLRIKLRI